MHSTTCLWLVYGLVYGLFYELCCGCVVDCVVYKSSVERSSYDHMRTGLKYRCCNVHTQVMYMRQHST